MVRVTISQAKRQLSQILQRVETGEEIIVTSDKEPLVKIVPIIEIRKERRLGGAKGIVKYIADDFDTQLSLNL